MLDAANTLIHKKDFYSNFEKALAEFDISISFEKLKRNHRLISECSDFPDKTSRDFYRKFNSDVLFSLGVLPSEEILESIHEHCSGLPWGIFDDVLSLYDLDIEVFILSNFHSGLDKIIEELIPNRISDILVSENHLFRKPDVRFYQAAIDKIGVHPSEIVYVGDSLKLDILPGNSVGMNSWLIDRDNYFPNFDFRLSTLNELKKNLEND